MFTDADKKFLLELSRRSIWYFFHKRNLLVIEASEALKNLRQKRASFVTLKKEEELRGCIGHLLPIQSLYKDIIQNSVAAAFEDPRFSPLCLSEFKKIKISISVLGQPKLLKWVTSEDLLSKLKEDHGVILKCGLRQATYLPEVWQEFKYKEQFLCSLASKAGLSSDIWTDPLRSRIFVYRTQYWSED